MLSFIKGCGTFMFGLEANTSEVTSWRLAQRSDNPSVYTRLSCYLPWVASIYGLQPPPDLQVSPACSQSSGSDILFW